MLWGIVFIQTTIEGIHNTAQAAKQQHPTWEGGAWNTWLPRSKKIMPARDTTGNKVTRCLNVKKKKKSTYMTNLIIDPTERKSTRMN